MLPFWIEFSVPSSRRRDVSLITVSVRLRKNLNFCEILLLRLFHLQNAQPYLALPLLKGRGV